MPDSDRSSPSLDDLREELGSVLRQPVPADDPVAHVRRLAWSTSIVISAFDRRGLRATLVGGGAIEFHAPGAYTTSDVDLVVDQRFDPNFRDDLALVFDDLGYARQGRHWLRDDMFVEVPGVRMSDPVEEHAIGEHLLRVVRAEVVLADRIVGFRHWGYTAYALQAAAMLDVIGPSIDETWLRRRLEREGALDAYDALAAMQRAESAVTERELESLLSRLRNRSGPTNTVDYADDDDD